MSVFLRNDLLRYHSWREEIVGKPGFSRTKKFADSGGVLVASSAQPELSILVL